MLELKNLIPDRTISISTAVYTIKIFRSEGIIGNECSLIYLPRFVLLRPTLSITNLQSTID